MSDRVTDAQAAEWRALCEAATEGPWGIEVVSGVRPGTRRSVMVIHKSALYGIADVQSDRLNDADFIAAARTALPALLDEREELRAQLKAIAGAAGYWLQQFEQQRARASAAEEVVVAAQALRELHENTASGQFNAHSWNSALRRLFRTVEGLEQ